MTDYYANGAVCSPTRAAFLTGRYQQRLGLDNALYYQEKGRGLPVGGTTLAHALRAAGYATGLSGKWHLGYDHDRQPCQQGFDHFFGFDNQGFAHFYYPEFLWRNDKKVLYPENHDLRINGEYKKGAGTYSHDEFTNEALDWIRENKDRPFFLYLPFTIPHAELTVPEDSLEPYLKLGWPEKPKKEGGGGGGYGSQ